MRRNWKGLLGLAISLALLWWVLRDVSPAEVARELREADPWLLGASVVAATFSFVLRAFRWNVLLEPERLESSFDARFGATCTGFAANNLFPARIGEFVRAYVLTRRSRVPFGSAVGSLVLERILDGLALVTFMVAALLSPDFPLDDPATAAFARRSAMIGAAIFLTGFATLWWAARDPARALVAWQATGGRLLPRRLRDRANGLIETVVMGVRAVSHPFVLLRAVAWSLVLWLLLAGSIWLGLVAFDIRSPGFLGAMFLQAVIGFSVAVPSTPGFFGVFEAGARIGLEPWGVDESTIASFATSYHILTFLPITLLGLWYLRRFGLSWGEVGRSRAEKTADDRPTR